MSAPEDALAARRRPGHRRVHDHGLGLLPFVEDGLGQVGGRVGRQGLGIALVGERGLFDQGQLGFAPHAQENHVVDDLLDLGGGHLRLEGGHRGAVQAVADGLAQVLAGRLLAQGRRGELEEALAVVAGPGVEERRRSGRRRRPRRRGSAGSGGGRGRSPLPGTDSGVTHLDSPDDLPPALVGLEAIGQADARDREPAPHRDVDVPRVGPEQAGERLAHLLAELGLILEVGGQPLAFNIFHQGAGLRGFSATGQDQGTGDQGKTEPRSHAPTLPYASKS